MRASLGRLYLAFGVDRVADFNSIITTWNYHTLTVRDSVGSYYKFRKFRLEGVYAEAVVPFRTLSWVYEPQANGRTAGGICPVVKELAERLEGKTPAEVYLCDATRLPFREVADVINVDPPYYGQHVYSDFSEFFWPLLKTMLEPALPLLFQGRVLIDWSPTEWRVPRVNEIIARGGRGDVFKIRLEAALRKIYAALKNNGLLILWYSHRDLEAWRAVVEALDNAGFTPTAIIPFPAEHPTRSITEGGRRGINRVLIIVARRKGEARCSRREILDKFRKYLNEAKLYPQEEMPVEEIETLTTAAAYAASRCRNS